MVKNFEIIGSDVEFKGLFDGVLNAWSFELRKPDGTIGWSDCRFQDGMPEIDEFDAWHFGELGLVPTGRVKFRGYHESYWDTFEGKWEEFVREVNVDGMNPTWSPESVDCTTSLGSLLANIVLN